MATGFRVPRILASLSIGIGWLAMVVGVPLLAFNLFTTKPGGVAAVFPVAFGFYSVLFGWLCRAAFDIADRAAGNGGRREA